MTGMNILEAHELTVTRSARRILDGASLSVSAGEVVAVLGQNGSGKSTLLGALASDIRPDEGNVVLAGRPLGAWTSRERARLRSVLPQENSIAFGFTALEVVLLGRHAHDGGCSRDENRRIAAAALHEMDVADFAYRRYPTLSGGEKLRVQIARVRAQLWTAWEGRPRLLLLDEPTASLDLRHQHLVLKLARSLADEQAFGIVIALHDIHHAATYADRAVLLKEGRVLGQGAVDEVLNDELVSTCYDMALEVRPWGVQPVGAMCPLPPAQVTLSKDAERN